MRPLVSIADMKYRNWIRLALADIAVERGRDEDEPMEIPTKSIAEKFIHYFWRQSGPYLVLGDQLDVAVLQQNTGKKAGHH